ncbi:MAG: 50S ribosomal protein L6 [Thermotogae bacterium]|nr:50S ribosomal protein L6 [Thermotogota bacterium]
MSRLIKKPIMIPEGVKLEVREGEGKFKGETVVGKIFHFKGPKGEMEVFVPPMIEVEVRGNEIWVKPVDIRSVPKPDRKMARALPGTVYRHLENAVKGVSEGYRKELKVVGTGYRVRKEGDRFVFTVGYSHPVYYSVPEEYRRFVKAEVQGVDTVIVSGTSKELVGLVAAQIRSIKEPNIYTGKGIRYADEVIVLKPTKKTKM